MESRDESGKWLFIAHAVCCGGPLLAILLLSNAAFLLSLVRSAFFWVGVALLLGGVGFYLIRRRQACAVSPSPEEAYGPPLALNPTVNPTDGKEHGQAKRELEEKSVFPSVRGMNPPTAAA